MSKAFTRESDHDDDADVATPAVDLPRHAPNYITPEGHARLHQELDHLIRTERPSVVETVAWAASNGDRSENGDYIYGKRRLREIDRRIRFLTKRLEAAQVVDPLQQTGNDQIFFGATVTVRDEQGKRHTYQIVGVDETDLSKGRISWVSPMARALIKAREGDTISFRSPSGQRQLEVEAVRYKAVPSG